MTDTPQPSNNNEPSNKEGSVPRLRTMKYDAEKFLKEKNISFLEMIAKEKEKRGEEFAYRTRTSETVWLRGVVTFFVLVLLAAGGYGAYVYFAKEPAPLPQEAEEARSYIKTEERLVVTIREGDRAGLFTKLEAERRDRLPSGSIKHVVVRIEDPLRNVSRFATTEDFFSTLEFKPPSGLTTALGEVFNFLIYYRPDGADIGMLLELKPGQQERTLAHMLSWESTVVLDWRHLYFDEDIAPTSQRFQDTVIKNVDARILTFSETADLAYAFFAKKYLIITTAEDFLGLIINRLLISPPTGFLELENKKG